jgi:uncharacterized membrane protein YeaQ/YmgE (transglycosylase-associated protein family)
MSILWTIIIGFVAGVIAKFLYPGNKYEPTGFILTTVLGIIGAFVATYLGQAIGWYKAGEGAGFIGAIVGAIIILAVGGSSHLVLSGREALDFLHPTLHLGNATMWGLQRAPSKM